MQVHMYACTGMCYYYLGDRKTIRSFSTDSVLIVQLYVCIYFLVNFIVSISPEVHRPVADKDKTYMSAV